MINKEYRQGYALVNGLDLYYEIHGQGKPLVLIHGGGSTIATTFGRIIPLLALKRQVIGVELQAHGHTGDRESALSFEQDADDIAALINQLHIPKADFLGFSNGGQTLIELALRHSAIINKLIIASAFYKRSAAMPEFWNSFDNVTIDVMPELLKRGYLEARNSEEGFLNMFHKDVQRMKNFKGWSDEQMTKIKAPTLIINATQDVGSVEHAVEMYRCIPKAELAIFPGGHGTYLGAIESLPNGIWPKFNATALIEDFLDK